LLIASEATNRTPAGQMGKSGDVWGTCFKVANKALATLLATLKSQRKCLRHKKFR